MFNGYPSKIAVTNLNGQGHINVNNYTKSPQKIVVVGIRWSKTRPAFQRCYLYQIYLLIDFRSDLSVIKTTKILQKFKPYLDSKNEKNSINTCQFNKFEILDAIMYFKTCTIK